MKATYEGTCECCEKLGRPARVTIEIDDDENVSATCESHGPWLFFRRENYEAILAAHRSKVAETAGSDDRADVTDVGRRPGEMIL